MEFDPDAYLAGSGTTAFNPDAYLGIAPQPAAPAAPRSAIQTLDDAARWAANFATFGYADKLAAGAGSLTGGGQYDELLKQERARSQAAEENVPLAAKIPLGIAGSIPLVLAGGPAGVLASGARAVGAAPKVAGLLSQVAAPATTAGRVGAGVAEGAALGALEATGRDTDASEGAVLGGLTGGAGAAAINPILSRLTTQKTSVTPESLKAASNAAYDLARSKDVLIKPQSFNDFAQSARKVAQDFSMDPVLQPRAVRAFQRIDDLSGRPVALDELENLKRIIGDVGSSSVASERALASRLNNRLDDYVSSIDPQKNVLIGKGDAQAGIEAFKQGRKLWSQQAKGSRIEELINRAETAAPNYSASGLENALRIQFRQVAMSPKQMRRFTKEEQEAIRSVAKGDFTTNALRMAGKMAPRGVVGGLGMLGVGSVNPLLALTAAGVGEIGKRGATARTTRAAESARNLMLSGQPITQRPMSPAERALYQSSIIGAQGLLGG